MSGSFDDRIRQGDLSFALLVAEELSADAAGPVGGIAGLGAGSFLRRRGRQLVAGSLDDRIRQGDLGFALLVAEELSADIAGPVGGIPGLGAGGLLRRRGRQRVAGLMTVSARAISVLPCSSLKSFPQALQVQ